jgi:hypothetical protein
VNEGELDQLRTIRHAPPFRSQNWYSRAGLPDAATAVHVTGWPTGRFPVLDDDSPDNAVVNAPIDAAVPTSWAALYAATEKSYQTPAVKPCTEVLVLLPTSIVRAAPPERGAYVTTYPAAFRCGSGS